MHGKIEKEDRINLLPYINYYFGEQRAYSILDKCFMGGHRNSNLC